MNRAATNSLVEFGQVIGMHIDDRFIKDGLLDTAAMRPIARGGCNQCFLYSSQMRRPTGAFRDPLE